MAVIVPPAAHAWLNQPNQNPIASLQLPPNLVANLSPEAQEKIVMYINSRYAWPQIQERAAFEKVWDSCLDMYLIKLPKSDTHIKEGSPAGRAQRESDKPKNVRVADSVVHDAVERLVDISSFVSFKEGLPAQYNVPSYFNNDKSDAFYDPVGRKVEAANALLIWNSENEKLFRKYMQMVRHHYLYGISFASSEFVMEATQVRRMTSQGVAAVLNWTRLGTTFEPISLRRLWLNYQLPAYDMNSQPCPFYVQQVPFYSILNRIYDPNLNPFGFLNLDKMGPGDNYSWTVNDKAMQSMREGILAMLDSVSTAHGESKPALANLLKEENGITGLWHFFPMLPLDPRTLDFETYPDGRRVPFQRFIVNLYGQNFAGRQILLRIQQNYYPNDVLPIYGSAHMPDLDSGAYSPSLGSLLFNHYQELVTCMEQYISNKDLINNPPSWVQTSSPAQNQNFNEPGAKIKVNGPNDFGWKEVFDATASTGAILQLVRTSAQTTSKSTDALLGKAMGSRTSATEANNAFQASMSAVTTPINLFNADIVGEYANRVWDYSGMWMPAEILKSITGAADFDGLKPEDLHLRIGVVTDYGSRYVESIVRQTNIRYVLEASVGDPSVKRTAFWKMLFQEFKFPRWEELIDDGGESREIEIATEQAIACFKGEFTPINPDQNHRIAVRVKTRFLEDQGSTWMTTYRQNAPMLMQQIQVHQQFLMLEFQEVMAYAGLGQGGLRSGMGLGAPTQPDMLGPGAAPSPGNTPIPGGGPGASGAASQQSGATL